MQFQFIILKQNLSDYHVPVFRPSSASLFRFFGQLGQCFGFSFGIMKCLLLFLLLASRRWPVPQVLSDIISCWVSSPTNWTSCHIVLIGLCQQISHLARVHCGPHFTAYQEVNVIESVEAINNKEYPY